MPRMPSCSIPNTFRHDDYTFLASSLLNQHKEPTWTLLTRPVKRALCQSLHLPYSKIYDLEFYNILHAKWEYNMNKLVTPINTFDCAICLEQFKFDGNQSTTKLVCGHQFCSDCIFRNIKSEISRGYSADSCCPLCRADVFPGADVLHRPAAVLPEPTVTDVQTKRRLQRYLKRRLKKLEQHESP